MALNPWVSSQILSEHDQNQKHHAYVHLNQMF